MKEMFSIIKGLFTIACAFGFLNSAVAVLYYAFIGFYNTAMMCYSTMLGFGVLLISKYAIEYGLK